MNQNNNLDLINKKLDMIIQRSANINAKLDNIEAEKRRQKPSEFISSTTTTTQSYSPKKTSQTIKTPNTYAIYEMETTRTPTPRKYIPKEEKYIDNEELSSNVLLELFNSIKDLRNQIAEIAHTQIEMKSEINMLKMAKKQPY
ncbi:hypothetical protein TVAG_168580 [Trichomonas vaginalis G3]|uniref:Uncharacterized protein n=1 Tax=Trichomonas vaginalis (strain ATCC PRA-98 / G3) TaxID=412133 RepID=A2F2G1_TRIV3|nr:hypothetical protein TVAGG3_0253250 [Trichomonas vaginalis G3]EAY00927.1 hypothetical protein TVAG_168580 [Trichomonas vaginalis G3]KAI5554176.1 hypothetical protein TVAGG3_0253250 [Trichomonas vaginalis G3]|eukprot:XP_001313856.1 hypothetical protein [Trichomonas vaginalis G3]